MVSQGVKIQNVKSCHRFQINCFRIIYGIMGIIGIIIRSVSSELNTQNLPLPPTFPFSLPCTQSRSLLLVIIIIIIIIIIMRGFGFAQRVGAVFEYPLRKPQLPGLPHRVHHAAELQ